MTNVIELIKVREKAKVLLKAIGNHNSKDELTDPFLSNSPDSTLTGQAYEDLHFAYAALERFIDSASDVIELASHETGVPIPEEIPEPRMIWITAGDMAYIDISSRVLMAVMIDNPDLLKYAAYRDFPPEGWKKFWESTIAQIRSRFL